MGLSADPEKRQRQLDNLAAGRQKAAANALGQGSSTEKPRKPAEKPRSSRGSRKRMSYGDVNSKPRKPKDAPKAPAAPDPPPEPPPRRTPLDRLLDGFGR